jgi:hypothetical protein
MRPYISDPFPVRVVYAFDPIIDGNKMEKIPRRYMLFAKIPFTCLEIHDSSSAGMWLY